MKIFFVYFYRNHGSSNELAINIAKTLGENYVAIYIEDFLKIYKTIQKSIIIFIKYQIEGLCHDLQLKNNKVIYFVVDIYISKPVNCTYDAIIYSNKQQQKDFSKFTNTINSYIYYHHYSPFYNLNNNTKNRNIGYFVAKENISEKLKKSKYIDIHTNFLEYKKLITSYKFHIEYRDYNSNNFLYKPCIKLSTSACADSVFICSRDSSYSELLPKNYEYFLEQNDNIEDVLRSMIISYNTDKYRNALSQMRLLKDSLNINSTTKNLNKFLLSLL